MPLPLNCDDCDKNFLDCICDKDKSLRKALEEYAFLTRWLYFDYVRNVEDATFHDFKKCYLDYVETIMDRIHDKYCDHIEAYRSQIP